MVKRILLGAFPEGGGKYGLRVSEAGYDVSSNPVDDEKLVFNSDWPAVLPIHQIGQVSLAAGVSQDVSFPSLGYVPFVAALFKKGTEDWTSYTTINTLFKRTASVWTGALFYYVDLYPLKQHSVAGDNFRNVYSGWNWPAAGQVGGYADVTGYGNLQIKVLANKLTMISTHNAITVCYFVYRMQAFT